jgi:hypothetical protein
MAARKLFLLQSIRMLFDRENFFSFQCNYVLCTLLRMCVCRECLYMCRAIVQGDVCRLLTLVLARFR